MMQRQGAGLVGTGAPETAGVALQHVITAVVVLIDPLTDRITHQRRLDLFGPVATVRVDAAGMLDPIDQHVRGFRRDDEINGLEAVCNERHPEAETIGAAPVEEAALLLRFEVGFEDGLVFRRKRRLLALAPWLGRVEGGLPPESANAEDTSPLALPVGVFGLFARRDGTDRHREQRHQRHHFQRKGPDHASVTHCCPPLCTPPFLRLDLPCSPDGATGSGRSLSSGRPEAGPRWAGPMINSAQSGADRAAGEAVPALRFA